MATTSIIFCINFGVGLTLLETFLRNKYNMVMKNWHFQKITICINLQHLRLHLNKNKNLNNKLKCM